MRPFYISIQFLFRFLIIFIVFFIIPTKSNENTANEQSGMLLKELNNFFIQEASNQKDWRRLRDILIPFFDLRNTNQNIWEKSWINASELEKERILGYLAQFIIIKADKNDLKFGTNEVIYINNQSSKDRAVIDTFIKANKLRYPISLRYRYSNNTWLIYDIFLDELSLIEAWKELNNAINSSDSFEIVLERIKSNNKK